MLLYSQLRAFQETQDELPLNITLGVADNEEGEDSITSEEFLERLLDFCLSNLPENSKKGFTLNDFATKFQLKMDDSLRLLLLGHGKYKVRINYEIHCPQVSCHKLVTSTSYQEEITNSSMDCPTCGHPFTPADDDVWITFSVV